VKIMFLSTCRLRGSACSPDGGHERVPKQLGTLVWRHPASGQIDRPPRLRRRVGDRHSTLMCLVNRLVVRGRPMMGGPTGSGNARLTISVLVIVPDVSRRDRAVSEQSMIPRAAGAGRVACAHPRRRDQYYPSSSSPWSGGEHSCTSQAVRCCRIGGSNEYHPTILVPVLIVMVVAFTHAVPRRCNLAAMRNEKILRRACAIR